MAKLPQRSASHPAGLDRPGYLPSLDGLRAVAILWVILWHTYTAVGFYGEEHPLGLLLVRTGWAGVDLFFALSGYLITSRILAEEEATGRFGLRAFYLRRTLRIVPAFLAVVALELLVLRHVPFLRSAQLGAPTIGFVASVLSFTSSYYLQLLRPAFAVGAGYVLLWSLNVEEHFYVLWSALVRTTRSPRLRIGAAAAVVALLPVLRWAAELRFPERRLTHFLSVFRLDTMMWGCLAALCVRRWPIPKRALTVAWWACAVALVGLVLHGELRVVPAASVLGASLGYSVLAIFCTTTVLLAVAPGRLADLLSLGPLRSIGEVSYGMYLVHLLAIDVCRRLLPFVEPPHGLAFHLGRYLCFVVVSIAMAGVLQRLVERPFLRLRPSRAQEEEEEEEEEEDRPIARAS